MKHFICFTVAILVFFSSAFTQNDTVCFDRSRINALSFVSPDYINSNDVSQIKKQVKKHYIRNKVLENLAINDTDFIKSIDTSEIKYLSELILTRYYGEKYNKYIMENVSVDSSEIRDYYTHHISHFTPPAKYSYSQAYLKDTSSACVQKAIKWIKTHKDPDTKTKNDCFTGNFENSLTVEKKSLRGLWFTGSREDSLIGPVKNNKTLIFYYIHKIQRFSPLPFSQVKKYCHNTVLNNKRDSIRKKISTKTDSISIILID